MTTSGIESQVREKYTPWTENRGDKQPAPLAFMTDMRGGVEPMIFCEHSALDAIRTIRTPKRYIQHHN